jgi:hypothetical protein
LFFIVWSGFWYEFRRRVGREEKRRVATGDGSGGGGATAS